MHNGNLAADRNVRAPAAERNVGVTGIFPEVAIAGCGAVTAVGVGMEALRMAMRADASGLRKCERFDDGRFQSCIAGAAFQNGQGGDDPAYELANQALREACEQAKDVL